MMLLLLTVLGGSGWVLGTLGGTERMEPFRSMK